MKKIIYTFIAALATVSLISFAPPAFAERSPICDQAGLEQEQYDAAGCNDTSDPTNEAFSTVRIALNSVYIAVAIAAVGVIIFGGFRFSLSQGDPGKVKKAKDTIMYAIIGLVVVISAFAITNFVLRII